MGSLRLLKGNQEGHEDLTALFRVGEASQRTLESKPTFNPNFEDGVQAELA
jgi:hypothetical protein